MSRKISKKLEVTCPRNDCPKQKDGFQVRYELEEEAGKYYLLPKATPIQQPDAKEEQRLLVSLTSGTIQIERLCPWCKRVSSFSVPV